MSLLRLVGIEKAYGGVPALAGVDLTVEGGEVLGLVGENGAGKSTLIKVVAGAVRADRGEIWLDEHPLALAGPADAIRAGIAVIYQELSLCPALDATENILLGSLPRRGPFVDWRRARTLAMDWLHDLAPDVPIDVPVRHLGVGARQLVEIARALARQARLIFMDEPTASLSEREVDVLFRIVRELTARGVSVVFVTHRLEEVTAVADRIVVLRDGRKVGELPAAQATRDQLIRLMVGREVEAGAVPSSAPTDAPVVLEARGLSRRGRFADVSFQLHRGEILGLAGLVGAGRTSLLRALFGADPPEAGTVLLNGRPIVLRRPQDAIERGIFLVPEDRSRQGVVPQLSVAENVAIASWPLLARLGVVPGRAVEALAEREVHDLDIRLRSVHQPILSLSGGNQQKVVVARWLARRPTVLLLDEPTRGIDVGAKAEIYGLIRRLSAEGVAILLSTSQLPELLALAHRILVLREGRVVGELPAGASQEAVMHLATGGVADAA